MRLLGENNYIMSRKISFRNLMMLAIIFGPIISDFCQVYKHKTKFSWNSNMIRL